MHKGYYSYNRVIFHNLSIAQIEKVAEIPSMKSRESSTKHIHPLDLLFNTQAVLFTSYRMIDNIQFQWGNTIHSPEDSEQEPVEGT